MKIFILIALLVLSCLWIYASVKSLVKSYKQKNNKKGGEEDAK